MPTTSSARTTGRVEMEGRSFEIFILGLLREQLAQGELGILPERAELFYQRPYRSRDRGSRIIVDLAIEVFQQSAKVPLLILSVRCLG